jgi:ABC-2 type transport system permease protein
MAYEERVRQFHGELRAYYYPKLFPDEPFDRSALAELPNF